MKGTLASRATLFWAGVLIASLSARAESELNLAYPAWPLHVIDNTSQGADGVRLADFDSDGLPDIATGWEEGGKVRIYRNPGPARATEPWPAATVGEVTSPEDAVLVDLDGNRLFEVISSCEGDNRSVYLHSPSWVPSASTILESTWTTLSIPLLREQGSWMYSLPMDIDPREGMELVVGSKGAEGQPGILGWLRPSRDPRNVQYWRWFPLREIGWTMSLEDVDVDGDGDRDILFSDRRGKRRGVYWLEREDAPAAPSPKWTEHAIGSLDKEVMFLDSGDLNSDGLLDVAVATTDRLVRIHSSGADAHLPWASQEIEFPRGTGTGKAVALADIDLDGRVDIAVTCENSENRSGVFWLRQNAGPALEPWEPRDISGPENGVKFDRIEMIDLDADGDLDLLTCEEKDNLGVIWYENPTRQP